MDTPFARTQSSRWRCPKGLIYSRCACAHQLYPWDGSQFTPPFSVAADMTDIFINQDSPTTKLCLSKRPVFLATAKYSPLLSPVWPALKLDPAHLTSGHDGPSTD